MSMSNKLEKDRKYVRPVVKCPAGRTKQSFADECNINNIVKKYMRTGMIDHVNQNPGTFVDLSSIGDYHLFQTKLAQAKEAFMVLSPELRERFMNDPAKLVAFLKKESNRPEAISLGLIPKSKDDVPKKVFAKPIPSVVKAEEPKVPSKAEPEAKD